MKARATLALAPSAAPRSLPVEVRRPMEARLGHDFSRVRIFAGSTAAEQLGADAFTRGEDVHFARGLYDVASPGGQTLLAHELAHVVQQRGAALRDAVGERGSAAEREAHSVAAGAARPTPGSATAAVQCQESTGGLRLPPRRSLSLLGDARLQLDPAIEFELFRLNLQRWLDASFLASAMQRPGLIAPSPVLTPPPIPAVPPAATSPSPALTPPPASPAPVAPATPMPPMPGVAPQPRPGSVGDVLSAVMKLPPVSRALDGMRDDALRTWNRASTGDKAIVITGTALLVGGIFAFEPSRNAALGLLENKWLPAGPVSVRFQLSGAEQRLEFRLDVASLVRSLR
jgi:hypothetical protein